MGIIQKENYYSSQGWRRDFRTQPISQRNTEEFHRATQRYFTEEHRVFSQSDTKIFHRGTQRSFTERHKDISRRSTEYFHRATQRYFTEEHRVFSQSDAKIFHGGAQRSFTERHKDFSRRNTAGFHGGTQSPSHEWWLEDPNDQRAPNHKPQTIPQIIGILSKAKLPSILKV